MLQRKLCTGLVPKMKIGVHDVKELFSLVIYSGSATFIFACLLCVALTIKAINAVFGLWRWKGDKDVDRS